MVLFATDRVRHAKGCVAGRSLRQLQRALRVAHPYAQHHPCGIGCVLAVPWVLAGAWRVSDQGAAVVDDGKGVVELDPVLIGVDKMPEPGIRVPQRSTGGVPWLEGR